MKVGLILYSVRDEMARDPLATVEAVTKMGYRNIEICNHNANRDSGCGFGVPAEELKTVLDGYGAKVVSAHIFPFQNSNMKAVLEYNRTLGNRFIVNPMGHFTSYDDLMRQCEVFNANGKVCAEAGMTYLYHNHHHEFFTFDGKPILDIIAENTDPAYLSFELDVFWVMRAGMDPVAQLKHLGKRVKLVHQKDFAWDSLSPINLIGVTPEARAMRPGQSVGLNPRIADTVPGSPEFNALMEESPDFKKTDPTVFTEIGSGIMPIQAIIDTAIAHTDAQYILLEQDLTRMPSQLQSVTKSMEGFRKYTNISWDL
jgi:sugar phosphate isomerase/epimerase